MGIEAEVGVKEVEGDGSGIGSLEVISEIGIEKSVLEVMKLSIEDLDIELEFLVQVPLISSIGWMKFLLIGLGVCDSNPD
jgi:hypothetical protein